MKSPVKFILKLLLALNFIGLFVSCTSQKLSNQKDLKNKDYWSYYESCISARDSFESGNYVVAAQLFEQAIKSVENPYWGDIHQAIEAELILGNKQKVERYIFLLADKYALLPRKEDFDEHGSTLYQDMEEAFTARVEQAKTTFNQKYKRLIDSLLSVDQKRVADDYEYPKDQDSLNTACLLKAIEKYGFPSAARVGFKHYWKAEIILLHADFDLDNKLLGDLMYNAVGSGEMLPRDYAGIIDRRCNFGGRPYVYFEVPIGYDDLSASEKEAVTKKRSTIGLRSVEKSLEITILPNGDMRVKPLD